ncbi:Fur family transcriptional regulator, zinc uptake regulator [Salinihabitans flavidus]|uniref:Fur family transcriptional regulator, zinc uptake regulator n=1 Tax=Salinihabitans flavidus TaxID=569882 RepID=A0A1H8QZM9_9RHOB|nr:transcriptional repressor [Salinihabitans flavidus]SEO59338.1 Fur family transcriptional regulator, zinc uptake regulator [Salinihabitans flavidus]
MTANPFRDHDHAHCIADALTSAEAYCAAHKLQFTPVRHRVLEILLTKHRAMGAYDILSQLAAEGLGSQPPVVYRALDFLTRHGFVHKIERLNAFIACALPGAAHTPAFMICRACHAVAETPTDRPGVGLGAAAQEAGFEIEETVIEAEGLCPTCRKTAPRTEGPAA